MKMSKVLSKFIVISTFYPAFAGATGMAVGLPNLYLQNNTNKSTVVTIKNIAESGAQFKLAAKSICRIKGPIMFQPFEEESNNFVVMVENNGKVDPVVIDSLGTLTLAHDSILKLPSTGNVKNYSLQGFCGNKLGQYKFVNAKPEAANDGPPTFQLINCNQDSNFVYFVNDNYIKVKSRQKSINFERVIDCVSTTTDIETK